MVYMSEKLNTKSKNKISQELKDEIEKKLSDLITINNCPRCGSNDFWQCQADCVSRKS